MRHLFCSLILGMSLCLPAQAGEVTVAVAANFKVALEQLVDAFTRTSGHSVRISSASTGVLYTQITQGAGFDLFLAADSARPLRLEQEQAIVPGSRFTYAVGRLVLLPADPARYPLPANSDTVRQWLSQAPPRSVAIANPKTAPYGAAAEAVYRHLELWQQTASSRVQGTNIAQAYQFVATGNAQLGFVALSQVITPSTGQSAAHWPIPADWYPAIEQQAVWLAHAADNPAAAAFVAFLQSSAARDIIQRYGYHLPQ